MSDHYASQSVTEQEAAREPTARSRPDPEAGCLLLREEGGGCGIISSVERRADKLAPVRRTGSTPSGSSNSLQVALFW